MTTGRINQVTILKTTPQRRRHPVREDGRVHHQMRTTMGSPHSGTKTPASPEASQGPQVIDQCRHRIPWHSFHTASTGSPSCRAGPATEETDVDGGRSPLRPSRIPKWLGRLLAKGHPSTKILQCGHPFGARPHPSFRTGPIVTPEQSSSGHR